MKVSPSVKMQQAARLLIVPPSVSVVIPVEQKRNGQSSHCLHPPPLRSDCHAEPRGVWYKWELSYIFCLRGSRLQCVPLALSEPQGPQRAVITTGDREKCEPCNLDRRNSYRPCWGKITACPTKFPLEESHLSPLIGAQTERGRNTVMMQLIRQGLTSSGHELSASNQLLFVGTEKYCTTHICRLWFLRRFDIQNARWPNSML